MLRVLASFFALTVLVSGTPAFAEERAWARLSYTREPGAERCPDERVLRAYVVKRLRYDPFTDPAPQQVLASITWERPNFVLEFEIADEHGKRLWAHSPVRDADCPELVAITGELIMAGIEPIERPAVATLPRRPLALPQASPPPAPAPPVEPEPPTEEPAARRPKIRIDMAAALAFGTAPALASSFRASLGLRWPVASVAIEGRADAPSSRDFGGERIRVGFFAGSVVPCLHVGWVAGCGVVTVGALGGDEFRLGRPETGGALHVGAGARFAADFPLGSSFVAIRVFGDVLGAIHPSGAGLDGRVVWTTASATGAFGGGPVFEF